MKYILLVMYLSNPNVEPTKFDFQEGLEVQRLETTWVFV